MSADDMWPRDASDRLERRVARVGSVVVVAGVLGFVALTGLAALAYSGGTYCEPEAKAYRFWGNFFCDLTATVTRRGVDNARVSALADAGFACFALAAGPFFWLLGGLSRHFASVRWLGLLAAAATALLAFVPSSAGTVLHAVAVLSATLPGLFAAGLGVHGLFVAGASERPLRLAGLLGASTLVAGLADAAGYVHAITSGIGCLPWLPALQKLVALLLLAWMLTVAALAARVAAAARPELGGKGL